MTDRLAALAAAVMLAVTLAACGAALLLAGLRCGKGKRDA